MRMHRREYFRVSKDASYSILDKATGFHSFSINYHQVYTPTPNIHMEVHAPNRILREELSGPHEHAIRPT